MGYVVFSTHEEAHACVEVGGAKWSESERYLAERKGVEGLPEVMGLLIGSHGKTILKMKDLSGAQSLKLGGFRCNKDDHKPQASLSGCNSERVHWVCDSTLEEFATLVSELEVLVASIHDDLKKDDDDETKKSGRKRKREGERQNEGRSEAWVPPPPPAPNGLYPPPQRPPPPSWGHAAVPPHWQPGVWSAPPNGWGPPPEQYFNPGPPPQNYPSPRDTRWASREEVGDDGWDAPSGGWHQTPQERSWDSGGQRRTRSRSPKAYYRRDEGTSHPRGEGPPRPRPSSRPSGPPRSW